MGNGEMNSRRCTFTLGGTLSRSQLYR
ncbi:hypothetical protein PIIN_11115 [Serendipita indica DSM 11827]|uniref:Uncharacterized protein n=1 Tax=Serendipita indica (strain DSM 11827) TaxID=1109443 RepID=G4U0N9_SERID|nr:hypothetical protein PIIN_11115 [Serendipita indica DSM 11827]